MLQVKQPTQQAAKGSEIKNLFKIAGQLHRAGYQVKITRQPGNVAILQERYST